jgi:hypothetical protein
MDKYHSICEYMIDKRNRTERINETKYNHEYSHIALFSSEKIKKEKLPNELNNKFTIGINSPRSRYNNLNIKTHAEIDAMHKLKYKMIRNNNKNIIVDLYVIRHTKTGLLTSSAPCLHCTMELSKKKWLKINKLYYSKNNGMLECIKFTDWIEKKNHHITKGWKNKNV